MAGLAGLLLAAMGSALDSAPAAGSTRSVADAPAHDAAPAAAAREAVHRPDRRSNEGDEVPWPLVAVPIGIAAAGGLGLVAAGERRHAAGRETSGGYFSTRSSPATSTVTVDPSS